MLRKTFFLLFVVLSVGEGAVAQRQNKVDSPQPYSFLLKSNPFPMLWGAIPLTSEFRLVNEFVVAPNQSSEIGISLLGKSPVFGLFNAGAPSGVPRIIVRGFRFQLAHRFFINNLLLGDPDMYAPEGFYFGPLFSYASARFTDRNINQYGRYYLRISHTNVNFILGHQWLTSSGIAFDVFTGFGYKENHWFEFSGPNVTRISTEEMGRYYRSNLKLILGFNMGIAF